MGDFGNTWHFLTRRYIPAISAFIFTWPFPLGLCVFFYISYKNISLDLKPILNLEPHNLVIVNLIISAKTLLQSNLTFTGIEGLGIGSIF